MFKIKIAYNDSCKTLVDLLSKIFKVEAYNEDNYKEKKKAYQIKNPYAARELPFVQFLYKDEIKKVFYTEDSTCTYDNILKYIEDWIHSNSKKGYITIEQIQGTQVGRVESGYTKDFMEGVGLYLGTLSKWYHTSVVKKIDWNNNIFETKNSIYKFNFKENEGTNN